MRQTCLTTMLMPRLQVNPLPNAEDRYRLCAPGSTLRAGLRTLAARDPASAAVAMFTRAAEAWVVRSAGPGEDGRFR